MGEEGRGGGELDEYGGGKGGKRRTERKPEGENERKRGYIGEKKRGRIKRIRGGKRRGKTK